MCPVFTPRKPRCSLSFSPDDHWLFEFMEVPSTLRYYQDKAYRDQLAPGSKPRHPPVRWGRAFFDEDTWVNSPKRIENLFRCEFTYKEGGTPWLTPFTNDPEEFSKILDEAERSISEKLGTTGSLS